MEYVIMLYFELMKHNRFIIYVKCFFFRNHLLNYSLTPINKINKIIAQNSYVTYLTDLSLKIYI